MAWRNSRSHLAPMGAARAKVPGSPTEAYTPQEETVRGCGAIMTFKLSVHWRKLWWNLGFKAPMWRDSGGQEHRASHKVNSSILPAAFSNESTKASASLFAPLTDSHPPRPLAAQPYFNSR